MLKIAHIINVTEITEAKKKSYLHIAQPVTLQSMVIARKMAKDLVDVELWAVKNRQEKNINIPPEFSWTEHIDAYAYEHVPELSEILPRKPLPRIKDIINSLYKSSDAPYFIYTNLDIGLYPDFYIKVHDLIASGNDTICINRLDIEKTYHDILLDESKLGLIYMLEGEKHGGIDCFIFRREIVPRLQLGNVFIGFPPVGRVLKTQIELHANSPLWVRDQRFTFHLGSDKHWITQPGSYASENYNQAEGLYAQGALPAQVASASSKTLPERIWNKIRLKQRILALRKVIDSRKR